MPAMITIAEFQERFGVSRSTVYRLNAKGELPIVHVGRSVRIRTADAETWFASLPVGTGSQRHAA